MRIWPYAVGWTLAVGLVLLGCGEQNEYLAEGKDLLKSERRNRIELAVEQFRLALETPLTEAQKAEVHYLLGYYDPNLTQTERTRHFLEALRLQPKKYEEALFFEALRDYREEIRGAVREALAQQYAKERSRVRKMLVEALEGKDNRDRYDAAWVLGYLAAQDPELIPILRKAMDHKRMETRLNAVIAVEELARHNPDRARELIPDLMRKIEAASRRVWWKFWNPYGERESPEVRIAAVSALGTMGATEQLLEILANKGSSLRSNAMEVLIRTGAGDRAIEVLLSLLEEPTAETAPWQSTASFNRRIVQIR